MKNSLFEVPVKVLNREGCGLPSEFAGAIVVCYAAAEDALSAVKRAKIAVEALKYGFDDLARPTVRELDLGQWEAYVQNAWPEDAETLPTQDELPELVERGIVFLSPAVGFIDPR